MQNLVGETDDKYSKEVSDEEGALEDNSKEIMEEVQRQMFKKARNYVGNNVLLQRGQVRMMKAKARQAFQRYLKDSTKEG